MSEAVGEFAHRHVATSYSTREGGVVSHTDWEGVATGYGTVFGSLIFDVADGATGGSVQWVGQAFPAVGGAQRLRQRCRNRHLEAGRGGPSLSDQHSCDRGLERRSDTLRGSGRSRYPHIHGSDVRGRLAVRVSRCMYRAKDTKLDRNVAALSGDSLSALAYRASSPVGARMHRRGPARRARPFGVAILRSQRGQGRQTLGVSTHARSRCSIAVEERPLSQMTSVLLHR